MPRKGKFKKTIKNSVMAILGTRNYDRLKTAILMVMPDRIRLGLTNRVCPLNIPLEPDNEKGWKPYHLFLGSTSTLNSLSCHASTLISNYSPHPPHKHKEEEILLLLSGEIDIILPEEQSLGENQRKRLKANQLVYYPSYFPHTLQTISPEPANYLMLKWSGFPLKEISQLKFGHFNLFDFFKNIKIQRSLNFNIIFEGTTEYLEKLQCHASILIPKTGYSPHVDSYDVAIILLEGEVETLGKRVKPHSVIFYEAGKPHGMFNPGESVAKYIVFEFRGKRNFLKYLKRNAIFFKRKEETLLQQREIRSVCLDASTICQLKCPTCPTSKGTIGKAIGSGFLNYKNFKRFIDENPSICDIELSNWGEIFLNPDLKEIIQYAYKKNVALRADNGANLNKATDDVLEALVRYKFRRFTCSIDGASQEVYSLYRINGNFEQVITNLRKINFYKNKYNSPYPFLTWQFVAFGHNENEIQKARSLAKELNMGFHLKLSWDDLYEESFSPIKDRELIRRESGLGVADRTEFQEKYETNYIDGCCNQLWISPRINFDGRLLGCCINYWDDYGNVFETGLKNCINSEKLIYAKQMLLGINESRNDIPCSNCKIYQSRKRYNSWIKENDLIGHRVDSRRINMLKNKFYNSFTRILWKRFFR